MALPPASWALPRQLTIKKTDVPPANLMEVISQLRSLISRRVKVATEFSHCSHFMWRVQGHSVYSPYGTALIVIQPQNGFIFLTWLSYYSFPMWGMEQLISLVGGSYPSERKTLVMWGRAGGPLWYFPLLREGKLWLMEHGPFISITGRWWTVWMLPGEHCGRSLWKLSSDCDRFSLK